MNITKTILISMVISLLSISVNAAKLAPCMTNECIEYFNKFKVSAKRGHPVAMNTLGQFYEYGYGTEKNELLALKYYEKSSRLDHPVAQYKAGLLYLSSEKHKDITKGVNYLEKSATNKVKKAFFLLGIIYLNKDFGAYDLAKADEYLAKAYDNKHEDMPTIIDYLNEKNRIQTDTFPSLLSALKTTPLAVNKNSVSVWPDDGTEVITVVAPPIEDIFHGQLMSFRQRIKSTGSRFAGRSCKQMKNYCISMGEGLGTAQAKVFYHQAFGIF
ncbi:MAG: sel1 repeat family protein [Colwellia sp.]|nr:sel1 repeat family protein [Colwellia sp.]